LFFAFFRLIFLELKPLYQNNISVRIIWLRNLIQ
jgi:hypothetical protein